MLFFTAGIAVATYGIHLFLQPTLVRISELDESLSSNYVDPSPNFSYQFKSAKSGQEDIDSASFGTFISWGGPSSGYIASTAARLEDFRRRNQLNLVGVIGYADSSGSHERGQRLSKLRAETVREILMKAGVPEAIISVRARGVVEEIEERCQKNIEMSPKGCLSASRRVEVFLHSEED